MKELAKLEQKASPGQQGSCVSIRILLSPSRDRPLGLAETCSVQARAGLGVGESWQ
jgi:hypothetical protein